MRVHTHPVAGQLTTTMVAEDSADLDVFLSWCHRNDARPIGLDTESTSLDTYASGFRLRLVQFGTPTEAWVIPVDPHGGLPGGLAAVVTALRCIPRFVAHNAKFDVLTLARHVPGVELSALWAKITDTRILAHLLDPRGPQDGGIGQKLKALSAAHVDPDAPDTAAGLYGAFHAIGKTKATGWAAIALDHPLYELYAGLDVVLVARLYDVLAPLVHQAGFGRLAEFEHAVALVCARMENRGVLLDVDYARGLSTRLADESERWAAVARKYGVDSVDSPAQVAAALTGMGEHLTETTRTGAPRVDKEVLMVAADLDRQWERIGSREPNVVAEAVLRSKRASKWRKSYTDAMLALRDANNRVHPDIVSLQARTARMSISRPPVQQLPSGDWTIRRAMLAEPGEVFGAADYRAVEMRVLAALSGDRQMTDAIRDGRDIHGFTAELIYGPDFTPYHRKLCKGIGFGKVYGGGPDTLSRQTGVPIEQVKTAIRAYDRAFAGVRRFSRRLAERAEYGAKEVVTPTGRRLPLDPHRIYAATNYLIQSTSRDVLADAMLRLDEQGLTDYLRLPIHDEMTFSAPQAEASDIGRAIADTMRVADFNGVPLDTDLEIGGRSWGALYGAAA